MAEQMCDCAADSEAVTDPLRTAIHYYLLESIGAFTAKDLRPYLVAENNGFLAISRSLAPRYVDTCWLHFRDAVICYC